MSNPAVTQLVHGTINEGVFQVNDSLGEAIQIFLADHQLDLTTEGLRTLSEELKDTLNDLINVDGFDSRRIDPVYLSGSFSRILKDLERIKIDTVSLGDLRVCYEVGGGFIKYTDIPHSRAFKALNGDPRENEDHRSSHHVGQSSQERLDAMKDSISLNGYPKDGQYIILFNDQMVIRDGQHRASCLYHAHGNIEVPVMRLYFNKSVKMEAPEGYFVQFLKKLVDFKAHFKFFCRVPRGAFRRLKRLCKLVCDMINGKTMADIRKVYYQ